MARVRDGINGGTLGTWIKLSSPESVEIMAYRGSGGTSRAGRWGLLPRADYLEYGNEQALCIVQLESEVAIRNTREILALDGIGTASATIDQARAARGYDYVVVSNDTSILASGGRAIVNALKAPVAERVAR